MADGLRRGVLAPLRIVAYRRLLGAMFVANVALFAHDVAAAWLMLQMTGSAFMVGMISVGVVAPQLLLGLPAGVIADRFSRTGLLTATLVCRAGVACLLAGVHLAGAMQPVVLVVASVLLGTGLALSLPAFSAMIPDIVPLRVVGDAISLQSAVMNLARALGPAVGGMLAGLGHFEIAFVLNGAGYLIVVAALRGIRVPAIGAHASRERFGRALVEGLRYVRSTAVLRRVVGIIAVFAVVAASLQVLLPTLAAVRYELSGAGYGVLSASFGAGALLGAVTLQRARSVLRARIVPVGVLVVGGAGIVLGLGRVPAAAVVALAVAGSAWVWTWTTLVTIAQLIPENRLRARTLSVVQTVATGMYTLGAAGSGALADRIGPGPALVVFAGSAVVASLLVAALRLPDLVRVELEPAPTARTRVP